MLKRLLLLGLIIFSTNLFGQCPTEDVSLASQADVDNFAIMYPDCSELNARLVIGGPLSEGDITDLTPLAGLTKTVGPSGDLIITNSPVLTSLEGLNNLTEVSDQFSISNTGLIEIDALSSLTTATRIIVRNNPDLINLDGLQSFTAALISVGVTENPSLVSIEGLSGISELSFGLTIKDNVSLPNLIGLENLSNVTGPITIDNNDLLTNLNEFENFTQAGDFFISNNDLLTDLSGLGNYTTGGLWIENNDALIVISGLDNYMGGADSTLLISQNDNLTTVTMDAVTSFNVMSISDNPQLSSLPDVAGITVNGIGVNGNSSLTDLGGLEGLQGLAEFILIRDNVNLFDISALSDAILTGTDVNFAIENNPMLSECNIASICNYLGVGGSIDFSGNAFGCIMQSEVEATCTGCPPATLFLLSQADVDNFPILYPDCTLLNSGIRIDGSDINDLTPLSQITAIDGGPTQGIILTNTSLTSLEGLNNITDISGGVFIAENPLLTSVSGLESLTTTTGFSFFRNALLENLDGLENVAEINALEIFECTALTSISGLSGLTNVNVSMSFVLLPNLESLSGLEGLTDLPDTDLQMFGCNSLLDLEGLQNLNSLGGLDIRNNLSLIDLMALANVTFSDPMSSFTITGNTLLSECDIPSICTYLNGGGTIEFDSNAAGCNSQSEVEASCEACPDGDVILSSQAEVDAFFTTASDCTDLPFSLGISGPDIVDLTPLNGLISVADLTIANNPLLISLDGLETLTTLATDANGILIQDNALLEDLSGLSGVSGIIGFNLIVQNNPSLASLNGLQNITQPVDDDVQIINNDALTNLQGLNGITTTDDLIIRDNDSLLTLAGLDSFTATGTLEVSDNQVLQNTEGLPGLETIFGLFIFDNPALTDITGLSEGTFDAFPVGLNISNNPNLATCNADLVCNYLATADPTDTITIENNAPGCDSREEVEATCAVCPTEQVILTSQAEVDNFPVLYSLCSSLDVRLIINGDNIVDLTPLSVIERFTGDSQLRINDNPNLVTLTGLENLIEVGGLLSIFDNPNLESLDGLNNLTSCGGLFLRDTAIENVDPLANLVTVNGELRIGNNAELVDLSALENITTLPFSALEIVSNAQLTNLNGLQNIAECENIIIGQNNALTSLAALNPVSVCSIEIFENNSLVVIEGLEHVASLACGLIIRDNPVLELVVDPNPDIVYGEIEITGNNLLTTLPDFGVTTAVSFYVAFNPLLTNLSSLAGLDQVFSARLTSNASLTDISFFEDFDFSNMTDLRIRNNENLSNCAATELCSYLISGATAVIEGNATGCASVEEVTASCVTCPTSDLTLSSQAQIDSFATDYGFCDTLDVLLTISGSDITDLSGLAQLTTLNGGLVIENNSNLTSLSGLGSILLVDSRLIIENNPILTDLGDFSGTVGFPGFRIINNDDLTSLSGLDGITEAFDLIVESNNSLIDLTGLGSLTVILDLISIRSNVQMVNLSGLSSYSGIINEIQVIGNTSMESLLGIEGLLAVQDGINIRNNASLTSLNGIQNCINETLEPLYGMQIINNNALTDISALNNFNANAVGGLEITNNSSLAVCNNDFICAYLVLGEFASFSGNAAGCESNTTVEEACGLSVEDLDLDRQIELFPNPTQGNLSVLLPATIQLQSIQVYNVVGQKVGTFYESSINLAVLEAGIYFLRIKTNTGQVLKRIVKH